MFRHFRIINTSNKIRRELLGISHKQCYTEYQCLRKQLKSSPNLPTKECATPFKFSVRNKDLFTSREKNFNGIIVIRKFHLSEPRAVTPILPVIGAFLARFSGPVAQLLKLFAVIAGRKFRKWWKKLPNERKEMFRKYVLLRKRVIGGIITFLVGGWIFLYYLHLEEAPYTKRTRYVGVTPKQIREIVSGLQRQLLETYADHIVPPNHKDHVRAFEVAKRLLLANMDDINEHIQWQLNVIESDEINAFVLPNGHIFVFTGLLRFLTNDDSLAIILGHEIAHAILQHSAEQLCFGGFINLVKVILLATIWALIPSDFLAFLAQLIQNSILGLFFDLPYSRTLEEEADRVGLYFTAKACFDVREGPKVWRKFDDLEKLQNNATVEWLSTHPSHANREKSLTSIVPEALALRNLCNCPELKGDAERLDDVKPLRLSPL